MPDALARKVVKPSGSSPWVTRAALDLGLQFPAGLAAGACPKPRRAAWVTQADDGSEMGCACLGSLVPQLEEMEEGAEPVLGSANGLPSGGRGERGVASPTGRQRWS